MNTDAARCNMLTQQIRARNILDESILDVIAQTPRHEFVPKKFMNLAYADAPITLAHGQEMLMPMVEASLLQALRIKKTDVVLEIGTGTGYMTALLAKLSAHVYTIDIFQDFVEEAHQKFKIHGLNNITSLQGDAACGWREHAPYNVVVITGSLPYLPTQFATQLHPHGRVFAILGQPPVMQAMTLTSYGVHQLKEHHLLETFTPALLHTATHSEFAF